MRWDRISLLTDQLRDDLIEQGWVEAFVLIACHSLPASRYFQLDASNSEPTRRQQGTLRTNCMDNLDRTNVVQAFVGKWVFNRRLQSLGILEPNTSIDDYEPLSKDFREGMLVTITRSMNLRYHISLGESRRFDRQGIQRNRGIKI